MLYFMKEIHDGEIHNLVIPVHFKATAYNQGNKYIFFPLSIKFNTIETFLTVFLFLLNSRYSRAIYL